VLYTAIKFSPFMLSPRSKKKRKVDKNAKFFKISKNF